MLFRKNAPELRTLKLEVYRQFFSTIENASDFVSEWPMLDLEFLARRATRLTYLHLAGVRMPWSIRSPIQLRSLVLDLWDEAQRVQYSYADMIRCLENMPLLQELVLWRAIPDAKDTDFSTIVELPHLKFFFVSDEGLRCLALWSALELTAICSIRIDMEESEFDLVDESSYSYMLEEYFSQPGIPPYDYVQVGDPDEQEPPETMTRISLHNRAARAAARTRSTLLSRQRRGSYLINPEPAFSIRFPAKQLESILALLPQVSMTTVSLVEWLPAGETKTADILRGVFRHFNMIERIEVHGLSTLWEPDFHELARAFCTLFLNELSPRSTLDPTDRRYLPSLHTLFLDKIHLWHPSTYPPHRRRDSTLNCSLTDALTRRLHGGIPLRTLEISNTKADKTWFDTWSTLVADVRRDGLTCTELSSDDEDDEEEAPAETDEDGDKDENVEDGDVDVDEAEDGNADESDETDESVGGADAEAEAVDEMADNDSTGGD